MFCKVEKNKALCQILIYLFLVFLFFIENITIVGKYNMHSKIDDMIPFIPIFVLPYFSWFIFITATVIFFFMKSKEDLRKTFLLINFNMAIAMIIYIIFPTFQSLRPTVYSEDFFSHLVKLLQIGDSSSSVCPSLHVAVSISLYLGIKNSILFKNNYYVKFSTFMLTVFICISTVFIKQHSVIDVFGGVLLSLIVYIFIYKIHLDFSTITSPLRKNSLHTK